MPRFEPSLYPFLKMLPSETYINLMLEVRLHLKVNRGFCQRNRSTKLGLRGGVCIFSLVVFFVKDRKWKRKLGKDVFASEKRDKK